MLDVLERAETFQVVGGHIGPVLLQVLAKPLTLPHQSSQAETLA